MDNDGFYLSQLVTGETGLVPSNFVEKVEDGEGGKNRDHILTVSTLTVYHRESLMVYSVEYCV